MTIPERKAWATEDGEVSAVDMLGWRSDHLAAEAFALDRWSTEGCTGTIRVSVRTGKVVSTFDVDPVFSSRSTLVSVQRPPSFKL